MKKKYFTFKGKPLAKLTLQEQDEFYDYINMTTIDLAMLQNKTFNKIWHEVHARRGPEIEAEQFRASKDQVRFNIQQQLDRAKQREAEALETREALNRIAQRNEYYSLRNRLRRSAAAIINWILTGKT